MTTLQQLLYKCSADFNDVHARLIAADHAQECDELKLEWLLRNLQWHATFTGSRRYGTPRADSDFDWVLYVARDADKELLANMAEFDCFGEPYGVPRYADEIHGLDMALRFGPVNAIIVSHISQWATWIYGTRRLMRIAPVTRDHAIATFRSIRESWRWMQNS